MAGVSYWECAHYPPWLFSLPVIPEKQGLIGISVNSRRCGAESDSHKRRMVERSRSHRNSGAEYAVRADDLLLLFGQRSEYLASILQATDLCAKVTNWRSLKGSEHDSFLNE